MKNRFIRTVISLLVVFSVLLCPSCLYLDYDLDTPTAALDESSLNAHFIDVGQGDSTLIVCGGEAMLVDGGPGSAGSAVNDYLNEHNITTLKYVVATHPHEDHIGGLDDVLNEFTVEDIIMPDASTETVAFERLLDAIENEGIEITIPAVGDKFTLGGAQLTILSPSQEYDDLNDTSIVFMMEYEDRSLLFTGDVGSKPINVLLDERHKLSADVYKVAHHGSEKNNPQKLITAIDPTYSVISCATDNSYGHPHDKTIDRLNEIGSNIYRTDKNGTVVVSVSREAIGIKTEN